MPAKLPTKTKELQGTLEKSRTNAREPQLPVDLPDRPSWVDDDPTTAQLFDQVVEYVTDMKISTRVDGIALGMLVDHMTEYLKMREIVREEGYVIEQVSRYSTTKVRHPLLTPMNQASVQILKILREYGLTAVSRSNVASIEDERDDFASFLDGG